MKCLSALAEALAAEAVEGWPVGDLMAKVARAATVAAAKVA